MKAWCATRPFTSPSASGRAEPRRFWGSGSSKMKARSSGCASRTSLKTAAPRVFCSPWLMASRGFPGSDPRRLSRGNGPDVHRPFAALLVGFRILQGSQGRRHDSEGYLPGCGRYRRLRRPGCLSGRTLGTEIPCHRAELAACLGRSHSVLRLPRRCPPDPLHHQFHRGAER